MGPIFRGVGIKKKVKAGRSERSIWGVRKSALVGGGHQSTQTTEFCDELQRPVYSSNGTAAFKAFKPSSIVLRTSALGLPQSIEINQRPDKKFKQGFSWGPCCCREAGATWGTRTSNRCPCLHTSWSRERLNCSLLWGEGSGVSRRRGRGVA